MRNLPWAAFAAMTISFISPAWSLEPRIDTGADTWVFARDIPPYSLRWGASLKPGGSGLLDRFFDDLPQNISASVDYKDPTRGMVIGIRVVREERTAYLDHRIEAAFRDDATARMDLPESSIASLLGNAVFIFCDEPPSCRKREYLWRSGPNIVVKIEATAFSPDLQLIPCPEPTEILQAYLQRYPSSLALFTENDERAKVWRRDQTALELVAAEYQLDRVHTLTSETQSPALDAARDHLTSFARLRESALRGPAFIKERDRIGATTSLPATAQITALDKIRQEYRQWWNTHQNDPVYLPPP